MVTKSEEKAKTAAYRSYRYAADFAFERTFGELDMAMLKKLRCTTAVTLIATATFATACGKPQAVRGEEVAGLDDEAMRAGLDRRDLQKMLHDNMNALQSSAVIQRWQGEDRPSVAVLPIRNDTSEHIDSALDSLISDMETTLINGGHVRVIEATKIRARSMDEVKRQQSEAFDPSEPVSAVGASDWSALLRDREDLRQRRAHRTTSAACSTPSSCK